MKNTNKTNNVVNIDTKKEYQKKLKNALHITYPAYASKTNAQNKKDVAKLIGDISHTIKPNDDGLTFKVRISNDVLTLTKKVIATFASESFLNKFNKVDDFTLKTNIATAFIATITLDDIKNANGFDYGWKIKQYEFLCKICRVINADFKR